MMRRLTPPRLKVSTPRTPNVTQVLHPALAQRAQMVKESHAMLSAAPGFLKLPSAKRLQAVQRHVTLRQNGMI